MNWRKHIYSLRWRLLLTYVALIVIGFGGLALFAGRQISDGVRQGFERQLEVQALSIANLLPEAVEDVEESESSFLSVSRTLASVNNNADTSLVLLNEKGRTWIDSRGRLPAKDLSGYDEVAAIMQQNVTKVVQRNNEEGTPTLYTAAAVVYEDETLAIVHLSTPATQLQQEIMQRWLALGAGVAILTCLALVTSLWLSSSLTQPLSELRTSALKLASGDFSQRIDEKRPDEIGAVASAFNHMAEEVQTMITEQQAFASNASHELRTPLATVRLRTELLRSGYLDPETSQRYLEEIDDEVIRLSGLVDDLIWLSRFDAQRVQMGQEQISPVRLLKALHQELLPRAEKHNMQLTLATPSHLPALHANRNHLHVVFRNLLDNALKYTPDGGTIHCHLEQTANTLHVTIRDNGRGISAEDLPHLKKRFFRADKARSRKIQGIGLGLSLVQGIVDFYGGRLEINSAGLNLGTTVEVWWPFEQESEEKVRSDSGEIGEKVGRFGAMSAEMGL